MSELEVERLMQVLENARRLQSVRSDASTKFFYALEKQLIATDVSDSALDPIIELHLCCVRHICYVDGNFARAVRIARRAVDLTCEKGSLALRRMALTSFGAVETELGNYAQGISSSFEAFNLATSLKDAVGQAGSLQNLALCLVYISQFNAAQTALRQAYRILGTNNDTSAILTRYAICTNSLLCSLYQEQYVKDESGISYCEGLLDAHPTNPGFIQVKTLFLSAAIRYFLFRKQPLRAEKYREILFTLTKDTQNPVALRERAFAEAMWLTHSNRPDEAIELLEDVHMKTRGNPHVRTEIFMALISALNRKGETQRAQRYADEMLLALHHTQQQKIGGQLASLREVNLFRETLVMDHSAATSLNTFDVMPHTRAKLNLEHWTDLELPNYTNPIYQTLLTQAITAEIHDDSSGMHCSRVGRLSGMIAQALNLPAAVAQTIRYAGQLHDLGKLSMPSELLRARRRLTIHERKIIEQHTTLGAKMIEGCGSPDLDVAYEVALHHHEWWDGSGYPHRLRGEDIPLSARIVAMADVYDALTHERPYKTAWTHAAAIEHMRSLRGTQFQPALFDVFMEVITPLWGRLHENVDIYLANDPSHPLTDSQLELVNAGKRLHTMMGGPMSADDEGELNDFDFGPDSETPQDAPGKP